MRKIIIAITITVLFLAAASKAQAFPKLGIHLLDVNEMSQATDLIAGTEEQPGAVTVVLRSDDHNLTKWQNFFDLAKRNNVTPIIRLATSVRDGGWRRPVKKDIVDHANFLSFLNWHSNDLLVVIFNEPNHAGEWGGRVDPESYAAILDFSLSWFHTETKNFQVLPAGLDAAAPNSASTMESFAFLRRMLAAKPELAYRINGWTSHSYPNPGFTGLPTDTGKASIKGFEPELALLRELSGRDFDVYITETGWKKTSQNTDELADYYAHAIENVWNDDRVKAVTPFVFAAHAGPFQAFSFTNSDGSPNAQYHALKKFKPSTLSQFSLLLNQ